MLTEGTLRGHQALWLENDFLKITILPNKGADIFEFVYKPEGIDFLLKTPTNLLSPGDQPPVDFLENYEGGWQELFPNPNEPYEYQGVTLPFHGEVALQRWETAIVRDDPEETTIRLTVRCQKTPFQVVRVMRLHSTDQALEIEGTITNLSGTPQHFLWGHHIVLGGNFLEEGCKLTLPAHTIHTPDVLYEPATARLAPGQREQWPMARGRKPGEWFDLRQIPGPQEHSHDDVFLADLEEGKLIVTNPKLDLTFWLQWDAQVFRVVTNWQPFGGADMPPLTGIYGLGIEPWVSRFSLADAICQGEALVLDPYQSLSTKLLAGVSKVGG